MKKRQKIYIINHFKIKIVILLIIIIITLVAICIYNNYQINYFTTQVSIINTKQLESVKSIETECIGEEEIEELRETINLEEYVDMPEKIEGYKVIGKIEIPKIKVNKYILEKTDEKTLKKSVTKICGPNINKTGNFCIAGHNYQNTFGKLKQLEKGDIINLIDTYNRSISYKVYDIQRVNPKDTGCLTQDTNGEREVTLVTCTLGAIKRIVVKAVEIYD